MSNRTLPRLLQSPAVVLLLIWMLVPLSMTLYFSFIRYVLNNLRRPEWTTPALSNWRGFGNYEFVLKSKDFLFAIQNSLLIVCSILFLTVILGVLIAVLINKSFPGQGIVRVLLISPFFVMPAVNAVLWINMILDPVLGLQGIAVAGLNDMSASAQVLAHRYLDQYRRDVMQPVLDELGRDTDYAQGVEAIITCSVYEKTRRGSPSGWLLFEMRSHGDGFGPLTTQKIAQYGAELRDSFANWVRNGKKRGEFRTDMPAETLAIFCEAQLIGAMQMQREALPDAMIADLMRIGFSGLLLTQ